MQRGKTINAYNEKGIKLFTLVGDALHGYTSGTVIIRRGNTLCIYDEKGRHTSSTTAR